MERDKAVCRKREGLKRKENSRNMKKKQILEGVIERVDFPNKGYVKQYGKNVFCAGTFGLRQTANNAKIYYKSWMQ